jgi:hypothetical protein
MTTQIDGQNTLTDVFSVHTAEVEISPQRVELDGDTNRGLLFVSVYISLSE